MFSLRCIKSLWKHHSFMMHLKLISDSVQLFTKASGPLLMGREFSLLQDSLFFLCCPTLLIFSFVKKSFIHLLGKKILPPTLVKTSANISTAKPWMIFIPEHCWPIRTTTRSSTGVITSLSSDFNCLFLASQHAVDNSMHLMEFNTIHATYQSVPTSLDYLMPSLVAILVFSSSISTAPPFEERQWLLNFFANRRQWQSPRGNLHKNMES